MGYIGLQFSTGPAEHLFLPGLSRRVHYDKQKRQAEVFYEKRFPLNFNKVTGKRLCHSLSLNKVVGLRPAILFKKRL